jgi:hypothetical protein
MSDKATSGHSSTTDESTACETHWTSLGINESIRYGNKPIPPVCIAGNKCGMTYSLTGSPPTWATVSNASSATQLSGGVISIDTRTV